MSELWGQRHFANDQRLVMLRMWKCLSNEQSMFSRTFGFWTRAVGVSHEKNSQRTGNTWTKRQDGDVSTSIRNIHNVGFYRRTSRTQMEMSTCWMFTIVFGVLRLIRKDNLTNFDNLNTVLARGRWLENFVLCFVRLRRLILSQTMAMRENVCIACL